MSEKVTRNVERTLQSMFAGMRVLNTINEWPAWLNAGAVRDEPLPEDAHRPMLLAESRFLKLEDLVNEDVVTGQHDENCMHLSNVIAYVLGAAMDDRLTVKESDGSKTVRLPYEYDPDTHKVVMYEVERWAGVIAVHRMQNYYVVGYIRCIPVIVSKEDTV